MRNTYIATWIILQYLNEIHSDDCTGGVVGENSPVGGTTLGQTNTYYLICDTRYTFGCCGLVNRWFYTSEVAEEVELQVWRPTGGTNYRLISSTANTAATASTLNFNPSTRYLAIPGDCIGWYSSVADVIGYRTTGNLVPAQYLPSASVNTAGNVDWSGATTSSSYEWALGAEVAAPSNPTFSGPSTGTISDAAAVNDPVVTVTFTDSDETDELVLTMTDTYFDIVDSGVGTASIIVKSSLSDQAGTHTLYITATDLCDHTVTGTVVITVTNTQAQINGLVSFTSTPECVTDEVRIATFTCNDTSGIADVSISESPASTPAFFFINLTGSAADEYGVYVRSQSDATLGQFNYNTQRDYIVTIFCDDRIDSVTENMTVNLIPNSPPVINNLPATGTLLVVNSSTTDGTIVFTVNFTDAEGDTVNVTFTPDPSDCPFSVLATGDVIALNTLATFTSSACDILVGVADKKNPGISRTLTISIVEVTQATTSSNADRNKTFFDDTRNCVWFSLLMMLLALTTAVTLFVCFNYVCMASCYKCPCIGGQKRFGWKPRPMEREYKPPSPKEPNRPSNSRLNELSVRPRPPTGHGWRRDVENF